MGSQSTQPSHGDSQGHEQPEQLDPLTAAQRNFAQVVGQALAEAWRVHLQHSASRSSSSEGVK